MVAQGAARGVAQGVPRGAVQGRPERTVAFVDLGQIQANLKALQVLGDQENGSPLGAVPMIKCNAYGHGLVPVAKALQSAPRVIAFGVATLDEAMALRRAGVRKPLWVFSECIPWTEDMAALCRRHHLTPILHSLADVRQALRGHSQNRFQIKINTGLNRLGVEMGEMASVVRLLRHKQSSLEGLCTHFAMADQARGPLAQKQAGAFREALALCSPLMPRYVHAAATTALAELHALGIEGLCNAFRPGLGLFGYGLKPAVGLLPALQWRTRILKTRTLQRGDRVGYGGTFEAKQRVSEAMLACGYGDGLMRSLSNKTLAGRRVMGRVSMDLTAVDGAGLRAGRWLTILGSDGAQGEALAQDAGTIIYEILTAISLRVPRIYESH